MRILGMKLHNHDCNVSEINNEEILYVLEFERISRQRYHFGNFFEEPEQLDYWFKLLKDYREDKQPVDAVVLDRLLYGRAHYKKFIYKEHNWLLEKIKLGLLQNGITHSKTKFSSCPHHMGHASGAFYTSPFKNALILSYDGAGDDGFTNTYKANENGIKLINKYPYWLGRIYKSQKDFFTDLKYDKRKGGEESVAGKLMALGGFGNHRHEWDKIIVEYIRSFHELSTRALDEPKFHVEKAVVPDEIKSGMSIESKLAYDWMYNFQYWFTEIVKEIIQKDLNVAKSNNLVITGGCALNCVANYHIWKDLELKGLYVPPNPNDCGLSLGFAYRYLYTKNKHNKRIEYPVSPYFNCRILDSPDLPEGIKSYKSNIIDVAKLINKGKLIGFIIGNSEMGPRALGNRSILCDPSISGMKDVLNKKVKFREWFRPFAPIVRLEDAQEYFVFDIESPYMSFAAEVVDTYKDELKEIVHSDGTARLQTLRRETNPLIWELLAHYKETYGRGVLLNTSFNMKGRPILSRYSDAFQILLETQLDYIYDGDRLYSEY